MKSKTFLLLTLLAFACAAPRPAEARVEMSFDFFFDALSSHGEWIEVGDYGSCWRPHGVDADWRPYSDGYWSYTDGGWTWVSYEEFGGIVYHYGRWVEVEDEGWCWVPDYEWAPAWVSWRSNDDYIGWAPLPPEARWRRETGFSVWVDSHYDIGPSRFNFCRVRDFGAPYLRPVIVSRSANVTIILGTANVTNISYYDDGGDFGGHVHCGGPSYTYINQHVHRPIPALKLVHNTNITNITNINVREVNIFNPVARGNQLTVLAPRVTAPSKTFVKPVVARTIPAAKISKGWAGVKDPDIAEGIRTRMRQESRGLTPDSAPARRVQAADLKAVPTKADPTAPSIVKTTKERGTSAAKKPAAIATEKPAVDKPLDPRTSERMQREQARGIGSGNTSEKPTATVVEPRRTVVAPPPPVIQKSEPQQPSKSKTDKGRTATRSIPSAVAPPTVVEKRTVTPDIRSRTPMVRQPSSRDDEAAARAAAAARSRAADEQRARSIAIERQRASEDAARRQKAQSDAAKEMQRRQTVIEQPRRAPAPDLSRMKANEDAQRAAAAQAAASRQRQIESARQQQAESARRSQIESARKEQAAAAARQQVQRQAPPPSAPRGIGAPSGQRKLSEEEMEALKKSRGR